MGSDTAGLLNNTGGALAASFRKAVFYYRATKQTKKSQTITSNCCKKQARAVLVCNQKKK